MVTETEWQCKSCNQFSSQFSESCHNCFSSKIGGSSLKRGFEEMAYTGDATGKRQRTGAEWMCFSCGNPNAYHRAICMSCKTIKPGLEQQVPGMDWVCFNCDNVNRAYREECNKCTMKRETATSQETANNRPNTDWVCTSCGNSNYPHRFFCNKCKKSREEVMSAAIASSTKGDWKCFNCDNVNLGFREECNKCRIDKEKGTDVRTAESRNMNQWKCTVCENINFSYRVYCNKCDLPKAQIGQEIPDSGVPQTAPAPPPPAEQPPAPITGYPNSVTTQNPAGIMPQQSMSSTQSSMPRKQYTILYDEVEDTSKNWKCYNCDNDNFPLRSACNKCTLPKAEAMAPETQVERILFEDKDWICPQCRNSNYHFRIHCNMCKGLRFRHKNNVGVGVSSLPQISYGYTESSLYDYSYMSTPKTQAYKDVKLFGGEPNIKEGEPTSSWICPKCRNVNWPKRKKCNNCGVAKDQVNPEWVCHYCKNVNTCEALQCSSCSSIRNT